MAENSEKGKKKKTTKGAAPPKPAQEMFNPYPGLRPFKIEESHLFFGREGQTDEVLQKLSDHKFVGIIGPSGSGKSSFVYCGVLPILFGGFMTHTGPNWDVIVLRPGSSPIENLATALLGKDPAYQDEPQEDHDLRSTIISTLLRSDSKGLIEAIKQIKEATNMNYLILVDQFEELFRYKASATNKFSVDDTLTFINLLMEAVNADDADYHVAITMRSDFIGECAQYADLTRKINDSHYLIPQLTREQKRTAIEGPASVASSSVAPRLVQRLLNDLGDNPDQLPILQHALMRTFDYWMNNREGNESLDIKHYEAIGTMSEALSLHADEAFNDLNDKQKRICEVMFKAITEKRGTFGIRRPTVLKDIAAISGAQNKELAEVIVTFRKPGRSFLTPEYGVKLNPDSIVDISHESLMRIWVRLGNWVDDEAESVGMYLRLAEAAEAYQVGRAGLWRPPDLQLALNWQVKHKPTIVWGERYDPAFERTMSFLEYSKKEYDNEQRVKELQQKRRLRAARITAGVLASATVISILFLVYAQAQQTIAVRQSEIAVIQRDSALYQKNIADSSLLVADYEAQRAQDSAESARLARFDALQQRDSANIAKDSAQAAQERAVEARNDAQFQQQIAVRQAERADSATVVATQQKEIALTNEQLATQAQFLAIAKGMGVKADGNIPDPQLRGLLAQQAYLFNRQYSGNKYDADIFTGLWAALGPDGFDDPLTQSLPGHQKEIYAIKTSRVNNAVYTAGTRGRILKWTFVNGSPQSTVVASARGRMDAVIEDIDVSGNGKWLAAGGRFATNPNASTTYLEIYNLETSNMHQIGGVVGSCSALDFDYSGDFVFFLDNDGHSLRKAEVATGAITTLYESALEIKDMDVSPGGNIIAGVGLSQKLLIWDSSDGTLIQELDDTGGVTLESVKFSPDERYLAYGNESGVVILLAARNLRLIKRFTDHIGSIENIDYNFQNGASAFMSTTGTDEFARIYNLDNLSDPPITYHENHKIFDIEFTPDNRYVFVGSERSILKVFPVEAEIMANRMCNYITRPMTKDEWIAYVDPEDKIPLENTCNVTAQIGDGDPDDD